jgi:glycosyltransferase A (GT-A) superfamily protein (DUF2064 family)
LILIGTDCPALTSKHIQKVIALLEEQDAVLVPATDGGYVFLAMSL